MTVPKIEATARMISSPMVSRREENESQRKEKNLFSSFRDNPHLRKKLALSLYSTPVVDSWTCKKIYFLWHLPQEALSAALNDFFPLWQVPQYLPSTKAA